MFKLTVYTSAWLGQLYCRHVPTERGKFAVWKRLFLQRIAPLGLSLNTTSAFGGRFQLDLRDFIQCSIYAFGEWEPVITAYLRASLRPGDVFIDVGANIGYFAVLAGKITSRDGIVHAIEASPRTFRMLQDNLTRNSLTNVRTHNIAVSDIPGELTLWILEDRNIGKSTVVGELKGVSARVDACVAAKPLGAIVPEEDILRARFIKIDVEGAEWQVLQGMRDLLPRLSSRTEVLLEVNAEGLRLAGASASECLALFRDAGFVPWIIDSELNQPFCAPQRAGAGIRLLADELKRGGVADLLFRRAG